MRILNASPEFGTPLTEEEIRNFLSNSKLNIHIGTIDNIGDPNIHPTWYFFDVIKNKFYIETSKNSKKIENIKTNNLVYYCVDDPNPPYKGVRGKGKVKIHEEIDHNIPIAEKIMVRYLGSLAHPMATSLISSVKDGDQVILEITPSYYSTWVAGYAIKKVMKIAAVVVGLFVAGLAYLSYKGFVDVKWVEMENATKTALTSVASQAVHTLNNTATQFAAHPTAVAGSGLPIAAVFGFVPGLMIGFRKG